MAAKKKETQKETLKGIPMSIYVDAMYGPCRVASAPPGSGSLTLFGRLKEVTLVGVGVDGKPIDPVFDATPERPAVEIRKRGNSISVVPVDQPKGMVGPMMGGAYVGGSDSRITQAFGFYGAVALHDRFETQETYDALSR